MEGLEVKVLLQRLLVISGDRRAKSKTCCVILYTLLCIFPFLPDKFYFMRTNLSSS